MESRKDCKHSIPSYERLNFKKEHFVYPPIVKYKGNQPNIEEINEEMPKSCNLREEPSMEILINSLKYLWKTKN